MKLLPLWIGFIGFLIVLGGVGNMELNHNPWQGFFISIIGISIMVLSLLVGRYLEKREEIPDWERRFQKKKQKRLGLT